jgi:hypothetical protein
MRGFAEQTAHHPRENSPVDSAWFSCEIYRQNYAVSARCGFPYCTKCHLFSPLEKKWYFAMQEHTSRCRLRRSGWCQMFLLPRCCERIIKVLMFRLASPTQGRATMWLEPVAVCRQPWPNRSPDLLPPMGGATWNGDMRWPHSKGSKSSWPGQQGTSIGASRPIVRGSAWLAGCPVLRTRPCPRHRRNLMSSGRVMPHQACSSFALAWGLP